MSNLKDSQFWNKKRVFITGHTGFKGSWLCLWLHSLGANVHGYALNPPTEPSLFHLCEIEDLVHSTIGDVRDQVSLSSVLEAARPEIVIHMAAQPLVRDSYKLPVETYSVNVMGTVHLLEAVRKQTGIRAVINVTTDKCYENREWMWGYRENDALGGYDPYSNSKACSELVTAAYRSSYFSPENHDRHGVALASARAGNVIGGGDWASDRLIPDCMRSLLKRETIVIRNPLSIRPWQHVLEPLSGYLTLAQNLYQHGVAFAEAWNFGPDQTDANNVEWIVQKLCEKWGEQASYVIDQGKHPHEANFLKLDCSKATSRLGWKPVWNSEKALEFVIEWTKAYRNGNDSKNVCLKQIQAYEMAVSEASR